MKIKYNGEISLTSQGISFVKSETPYEVSDGAGKYLLSTFKDLFEEIKEKKEPVKKEVKEEAKPRTKAK